MQLTEAPDGGGRTISGSSSASADSAFRHPETCSRPTASTNENFRQSWRPNARRLPNCSCGRIEATRALRHAAQCAADPGLCHGGALCTAKNALFRLFYDDMVGLTGGIER